MTAQEVGHLGIEIKAQEDPKRVAEYQNKGHQLVLSTTNGDVTEATPLCRHQDYAESSQITL